MCHIIYWYKCEPKVTARERAGIATLTYSRVFTNLPQWLPYRRGLKEGKNMANDKTRFEEWMAEQDAPPVAVITAE
jgi:hypothetical protein